MRFNLTQAVRDALAEIGPKARYVDVAAWLDRNHGGESYKPHSLSQILHVLKKNGTEKKPRAASSRSPGRYDAAFAEAAAALGDDRDIAAIFDWVCKHHPGVKWSASSLIGARTRVRAGASS